VLLLQLIVDFDADFVDEVEELLDVDAPFVVERPLDGAALDDLLHLVENLKTRQWRLMSLHLLARDKDA